MKKFLIFAGLMAMSIGTTSQLRNEATDGDLSDAFDEPSGPFTLAAGDNTFTANQLGDPRDLDYFTIILPPDLQIDKPFLDGYTADGTNNNAFLGIQEGVTFTTDAMNTQGEDLLGGITYGSGKDTDILLSIGLLGQGSTPPLPTGKCTIWLNQTGPLSEATLRFVVSGTISTEDVDLINDITIFPNPVNDLLTINKSGGALTTVTIYGFT